MQEKEQSFAAAFLEASEGAEDLAQDSDGLEQPTPGEDQPDENTPADTGETPIDTVEIDGKAVKYFKGEDGVIEYETPDGYDTLDADAQKSFDRKAEEAGKTLASLKKERMNQNSKDREIAELKQMVESLSTGKPKEPPKETLLDDQDNAPKRYWGVETWAQVADLQTDDPEAYSAGLDKKASEAATAHTARVAKEQAIHNKITGEGHSVAEVQQFAETKKIGSLEVAFDYFKLQKSAENPMSTVRRKIAPGTIPPKTGAKQPPKISEVDHVNDLIAGGAAK